MSFNMCRDCRHSGFCTFPRQGPITDCDEYEHMSEGPAFDWDLKELMKLGAKPRDESETQR